MTETITRYASREQIQRLRRFSAMCEWNEIEALLAASLEGAVPDHAMRFADLTQAEADAMLKWLCMVVTDAGEGVDKGGAA